YARGLEDGRFPVVSWIADRPPQVNPEQWQLEINGAVSTPKAFKLSELQARSLTQQTATLDCTGGWYTIQDWEGVSISELLKEAGALDTAVSITVRSVTGYKRRFSLKEANTYILALNMSNEPLSQGHGYPVRLIAFDKRGVEWVKWVDEIQVNTTSKIWQSPLPLQ
ncbi:MAG: molybdopterin-dependent oxidoreductase, partial [Chloroflexota bacterium]